MHRNKSVDVHQFAMVPRADIPRSSFRMQKAYKSTFNSGYLIPIFVEEVLPGDSFHVRMTAFARMATPIFPIMDNLYLESFFFFVPNRLVWTNWQKFMGEQTNPGDSISFAIPQIVSPVGGYAISTIYDYFGLPTVGQMTGATFSHSALPLRCYNLIWNQWFRDENIASSAVINVNDGPDSNADYALFKRFKRHDYFTSALPFLQKGTAVGLPLAGNALVKTSASETFTGAQTAAMHRQTDGTTITTGFGAMWVTGANSQLTRSTTAATSAGLSSYPTNLYADLSSVTAATINQLRQAFQIQKLLERDARGGTRYTEIVRSHFGVISPDSRLQRPEYLGGGTTSVNVSPVAQTSASAVTGSTTPIGNLSGYATAVAHGHGFSQSFTEHGHIIGVINVRADLTYQQGVRKFWFRSTRYDFYFPVFAALGEQSILNKEIYADGSANDPGIFGYQERWAEYRYSPSMITGLFRSTAAGTLDAWHVAQKFTALPTLNSTFLAETVPIARVIAVPSQPEFLLDAFFDMKVARPMPMFSVPGLIDHF